VQRFQLLGIVAAASGQGAALIAVDGQPARPFSVGAQVAPGFVVQRLSAREVMLGESREGPLQLSLRLPAWEPRSNAIPGAPGSAPAESGDPTAPLPPAESTAVQPARRGDQRAP
jgi:general secretion pathway protein C